MFNTDVRQAVPLLGATYLNDVALETDQEWVGRNGGFDNVFRGVGSLLSK
jgi:hypothetical protein